MSKMSPPTNDVTNGVVAPPSTLAPRVPPTANPSLTTINPPTHKRTPKDFIFGKVIGEGSFSTVSYHPPFLNGTFDRMEIDIRSDVSRLR